VEVRETHSELAGQSILCVAPEATFPQFSRLAPISMPMAKAMAYFNISHHRVARTRRPVPRTGISSDAWFAPPDTLR